MVAHNITTQPILDLYERVTWRPGARVSWQWWEQACIDFEGAKKRAVKAATVSESESELESNVDLGREKESRGASGSSGAEWSGAED